MENATIRINKVAKELNISLNRAVDFLNEKGYKVVDMRPNSKITQQMYNTLLDNFQSDRSERIESDEVGVKIEKEKEQLLKEIEQKEEEVIRAKVERISGLKQIGKIDLDNIHKKKTPTEDKNSKKETKETKETINTAVPKDKPKPSEPKENMVIKAQSERLSGPLLTGQVIDLKPFEDEKLKKAAAKKEESSARLQQKKRRRIRVMKNDGKASNKGERRGVKTQKAELSDEEIQKQVRKTLEKLQGKKSKSKGAEYRREKRSIHRQKTQEEQEQREIGSKTLKVTEFVTLSEMSALMENVPVNELISACMSLGIMASLNQRLDAETLSIVAEEFGYELEFTTVDLDEDVKTDEDNPKDLIPRAPVVTVMGHVDHGKTSLLDYIRKENVIAGESGGITQHIAAYSVNLESGQKITFLDTPGHEAFTAMRARGTKVTDVVIIVIAADDDVKPQTKEAISHAQAAGVPMIFAINKVDKPNANPEKIKEALSSMDILVEEWGGKIQSQEISAKIGTGVEELLEKVLLEAELLELKANPKRNAQGSVIEAYLDKGRGYVSTVLVQTGTLRVGDYVLSGKNSGKVKAMFDERGKAVEEVSPATPVSVLGLDGVPQAGDKFYVFDERKEAKQIADKRSQLHREQSSRTKKQITLDEIGRRIALGDFKELNVIIKGDVDGSVEALMDSIQKLSMEEIQIKIMHKGVGPISESDVLLASASNAIIIGFNVRPSVNARTIAEREKIDIRLYSIIFDAINDVRDAIEGMLSPEIKEEITGKAEVRQLFKVSKIGTIAGCMVTDGKIFSSSLVRLIRDDTVVYTGKLSSLKRFKDDVKEVGKGYDCGIQIKSYNDLIENDIIEAFNEVKVRKKIK